MQELTAAPTEPAIEIVCDFDGTIARPDTVDQILEALADPSWRLIEARWRRGEIDSRECMDSQVRLLSGGWAAIESFLEERVRLHPSFRPFAAWCERCGIPLRIASEGIDRVIHHLLRREQVSVASVWASRLVACDDGTLGLDFSHAIGRTHCGARLCKCELLNVKPARPFSVLIGDGRSDFCAAGRADLVFARTGLLRHCRAQKIPYIPFESFDSVRRLLEERASSSQRFDPSPAVSPEPTSRLQLALADEA
jgi:2,3-diketo-5-methylthio-1-phosphopentane phosphatase